MDLKMEKLAPYLMFNRNCEEAVNFYKECFNGKFVLWEDTEIHQWKFRNLVKIK